MTQAIVFSTILTLLTGSYSLAADDYKTCKLKLAGVKSIALADCIEDSTMHALCDNLSNGISYNDETCENVDAAYDKICKEQQRCGGSVLIDGYCKGNGAKNCK